MVSRTPPSAALGVVSGGGGDVGTAGRQRPVGDAWRDLLDGPVGCLFGAMVRAAAGCEVGLTGRAGGPWPGVVQVGGGRRILAAGGVARRGARRDRVPRLAAGRDGASGARG